MLRGSYALRPSDLGRLASVGLRTRKLRAGLSALGIAIGVGAIVAVLGLSASSQAGLIAEINQLGTNMLTVENGQTIFGQSAELPSAAPAMIGRIAGVTSVDDTAYVPNVDVYRSPLIADIDTNALSVQAASLGLLSATGTCWRQRRIPRTMTAMSRRRSRPEGLWDSSQAKELFTDLQTGQTVHPRSRELPQRGHGPGASCSPGRSRSTAPGNRPRVPRRAHLAGQ